jgi:ABC-type transport system substrate-binding protein
MNRAIRIICILLCALCLVSSCSSKNRVDGYVYYRLNANPSTLDPALIVDVPAGTLAAKLFNGLVGIGADFSIRPDIAEHWHVSKDGLTYTFNLKKGVTFSNKREVTARDFKYSFERILAPNGKSPNTWVFEKILGSDDYMKGTRDEVRGIKVVDDYTLEIRLRQPFSPFLSLLTMTTAYVVPREEVERWGPAFSTHPLGTGPFVLREWLPDGGIKLDRRKDYFEGSAHVSGIMYRVIPEDLTAVTEFEIGNIDVLPIPVSEFPRYRKDPEKTRLISSINGLNTYYIGFNCSRRPFDNPNLRKAVALGIDRQKILNTIYEERGRLASGPLPDILRKWDVSSPYSYDPVRAKALIKRERLQGLTVNFYITAEQEIIDIAEVIQSYLNEIGINVKIKQLEWSAYKEAVNKGEPDMFYLSWWADYPDPENFLFPLFHSSNLGPAGNRTRYRNAMVDSLIEAGRRTLEEERRESFYRNAEEIIVADAPMVFLWHRTDFTIRQPWIKNYRIYPIYSMDKGTEISF